MNIVPDIGRQRGHLDPRNSVPARAFRNRLPGHRQVPLAFGSAFVAPAECHPRGVPSGGRKPNAVKAEKTLRTAPRGPRHGVQFRLQGADKRVS